MSRATRERVPGERAASLRFEHVNTFERDGLTIVQLRDRVTGRDLYIYRSGLTSYSQWDRWDQPIPEIEGLRFAVRAALNGAPPKKRLPDTVAQLFGTTPQRVDAISDLRERFGCTAQQAAGAAKAAAQGQQVLDILDGVGANA